MQRLAIDVSSQEHFELISLSGRLDAISANEVKTTIVSRSMHGASSIVLDMANVSFVDSSGFGAIVAALIRIKENETSLRLVALQPSVRKCFEIVKLDQVFEIVDSIEDCL